MRSIAPPRRPKDMSTESEITHQLNELGCTHKLSYYHSAAFILLHVNPKIFEYVEQLSGASISQLRQMDAKVLISKLNPDLWVEMGKILCEKYKQEIEERAPPLLKNFLDGIGKDVQPWVPVCLSLALAIPKEDKEKPCDVETNLVEAIKKKASEAGMPIISDENRRCVYTTYTTASNEQIVEVYMFLFKVFKQK